MHETLRACGWLAALFVPIWLLERWHGASMDRYRGRHFAHDLAYALFYRGGWFAVLGTVYVASGVEARLQVLRWNLLGQLPSIPAGVLYWIVNDFFQYWMHRAQHAVPLLWQFHSVHHANEELTFASATRIHPFENFWQNTVMVVPMLVIGFPPRAWIPVALLQSFFDAVQHASLPWTYGPLYRIFVSPVFHRIHHSRERRHFDKNFSKVLSAWDYAFGTASTERVPPAVVGVAGLPSERTLAGQVVNPFVRIVRAWRAEGTRAVLRPYRRTRRSTPASQAAET